MKICKTCKVSKPIIDFYKVKGNRDGFSLHCKKCFIADSIKWRLNKRHTDSVYAEKVRVYSRKVDFKKHLLRKYNITSNQYMELFDIQNGLCAICGNPETRKNTYQKDGIDRLSVDHNHETGKIRGLLCHRCNIGIGIFMDNEELLTKAINYLKERN
jgi:hypothetical protein